MTELFVLVEIYRLLLGIKKVMGFAYSILSACSFGFTDLMTIFPRQCAKIIKISSIDH